MPGTPPQDTLSPSRVENSSARRSPRNRLAQYAAILACALAALALFWWAAQRHSHRFNTKVMMEKHDQLAIMTFTRRVQRSLWTPNAPFYSGTRNKMPLYPLIQSFFLTPGESDAELFEEGKTINIVITMAGLVGLGFIFFRIFSVHLAANLTLIAAFSVFVYKAAYFQPDTLSYFLAFGVFLLIWRLFVAGGVFTALLCGVLLALAHYCKATAPPILALFVVFFGAARAWEIFRALRKPHDGKSAPASRRPVAQGIMEIALVVGVSILLLGPYLKESKARFGSYLYNVNSTTYMWLDSWEEAKRFSEMYSDRHQAPNLPPEQLPGPRKYLRDHSVGQIITRFWKGMGAQLSISLHSYGYAIYVIVLAGVVGFAAWRQWDRFLSILQGQPFLAAFLLAYFGGYFVLFSWYEYVGRGQRFIIGLFLPALFTLGCGFKRLVEPSRISVPIRGSARPLAEVANWAVTIYLLIDIIYTVSYEIVSRNGGS